MKRGESYSFLFLTVFLILISSIFFAASSTPTLNGNQSFQENCTYGTYQCNGNYLQKCDGLQWFDADYCKTGCSNGQCNEGSYEDPPIELPQEPKLYQEPTPEPQPSSELLACQHLCGLIAKNCGNVGIEINECNKKYNYCWENCSIVFPLEESSTNNFADYGDAPDPTFPSLKANNGVRHLNTQHEWLGFNATKEVDSRQINIDENDDGITEYNLLSGFYTCYQKAIPVIVSVKNRNDPTHDYLNNKLIYLNMLFDWNKNGEWSGQIVCGPNETFPEHAVVNYPINVSSWPPGVTTQIVNVPVRTGGSVINSWIRATLTYNQQVNFPWNGAGTFNYGETEDYYIQVLHNESRPEYRPANVEELSTENFQPTKKSDSSECQNNTGCESNICINGSCTNVEDHQEEQTRTNIDKLVQVIKNFFNNLF